MGSRAILFAAVCAVAFSMHTAEAYVHTQVTSMSNDCQTRYNDLLASIPQPFDPDDEANCHDTIVNATENTNGVYCPTTDIVIACFQVSDGQEYSVKSAAPSRTVSVVQPATKLHFDICRSTRQPGSVL